MGRDMEGRVFGRLFAYHIPSIIYHIPSIIYIKVEKGMKIDEQKRRFGDQATENMRRQL